jgi:hypothetical protein
VYVLGLVEYPLRARSLGTPEEILDEHLSGALRFPGSVRTVSVPFSGRWTVWQAFDGPWTHQGPWRYAYDFVITNDDDSTHRRDGSHLEDYLAFHKPILSPIKGRVVRAVASLPDNPIGETDRANNWGNHVVLKDDRGFYVEISHFAQQSVRVKEGEWVERGTLLGLCGNSGYSPQPHVHIQVQTTEQQGAPTLPFSFVGYGSRGVFHANDTPPVEARVESLPVEKALENRMGFVLDEMYRFRVAECDRDRFPDAREGLLEVTVRMAPDATFYLDTGRGRLFFGSEEGTFYFYRMDGNDPCLRALFLALPRLPLAYRDGLAWADHVPAGLVTTGLRRALIRLVQSVHPRLGTVAVHLSFEQENMVTGHVTSRLLRGDWETRVVLHPRRGFQSVRVGDLYMERIDDERA